MISIEGLDSVAASNNPHEFEYKFANGRKTGIMLKILGDDAESVAIEQAALMAEERARAAASKEAGKEYQTDMVKLGQRMAAIRIVGWAGIADEFTKENALKLCMVNKHIADEVMKRSRDLGNFIKL